jgi:hypothetical protein
LLGLDAVGLALFRAVNAVEADAFTMIVVQDLDRIAVNNSDD